MQFSLSIATFVLALTASAAPTSKRQNTLASGSDTNGSIFMFGDPAPARQLLYTVGACGLSTYFPDQVDPNIPLVAMPANVFDQFGFAQHNTLCAKVITLTKNGVTRQAVIADRNLSNTNSIDMTLDLWQAFGGHDNDGSIIPGFSWSISE
ncbi:hypothetical protein TARUN_4746 [Trichoderma arundinaceum]|uniref:Barwin-like endoglucanase n=1 Tax=Trichoderma arundinaceum TaxID=490622 RepID=A0A395NN70_TRIAR|nr:hypothetical protein TARUN_4746 [Trichoderma arundinaceum]